MCGVLPWRGAPRPTHWAIWTGGDGGGCGVVRMNRLCLALPIALVGLSPGCSSSSSDAGDCRKDAGSSICLVSNGPGSYHVEATGLGPASQVRVALDAPGSDPKTPFEGVADAKGSFPGTSSGVYGIALGGPADVTVITVSATSSDGDPIKAVFHR